MRGVKQACKMCGMTFVTDNDMHTHCVMCQQPNGPMRRRQQAQERLWTEWLIRQLEPFLGSKPVSVNDLVLYLREQAEKSRAA